MNRTRFRGLVFLVIAAAFACNSEQSLTAPPNKSAAVASVTVAPGTTTMGVGQTSQFTVVAKDVSGNAVSAGTVSWTSSNSAVCTISASGIVTARSSGSASIVATTGDGKSGSAALNVTPNIPDGPQTGSVNAITVAPSSGTIPVGGTRQYSAILTDLSGNVLTGQSIIWSSSNNSIVTVDGNGLARAIASGFASVVAMAGGKTGVGNLSVSATTTPTAYAHQPAGYTVIAENNFTVLPVYPATASGLVGKWWELTGGSANTSIVSVPDAPQSAPLVMQTRFPTGLQAGTAPASYGGWDQGESGTQLSKMYVSMWIRITGTDYENQLVGTKIAYMGFARDASSALNDGYFWIPGDGVQAVHSSFNLEYREQNNVSRNLPQNVDVSKVLTVGSWHHFEFAVELNALGSANGKLKWWVDDRLILDYSDMVFIVPGASSGFQGFKVDPVWGGLGGVRTRDDFMQVDHIYISGMP